MSTAPVKSIIDEQIEEVAGRTLADAQELARRRGLTGEPALVTITRNLVVLRFEAKAPEFETLRTLIAKQQIPHVKIVY